MHMTLEKKVHVHASEVERVNTLKPKNVLKKISGLCH